MVAEATGSPTFAGTGTVAQLWASIPGFPMPNVLVGDLPRCLHVETATAAESGRPVLNAVLSPTHAVLRKPANAAAELLAPFPTARRYEAVGERPGLIEGAEPRAIVAFPGEDGNFRPLSEVAERVPDEDGPLSRGFVFRPPVGDGNTQPPTQLVTLWALLFALSQLTRYYPAAWVGALDEDDSDVAVTLDEGLELALALAPELISRDLGFPLGRAVQAVRQAAPQNGPEL